MALPVEVLVGPQGVRAEEPLRKRAMTVEVPAGLSDQLKARTLGLHREAERSGVLRDVLRGDVDRAHYAMLLRNLLPVYEALEHALDQPGRDPCLASLADPAVYRVAALRADVLHFDGTVDDDLDLVPSAAGYAARIAACAQSGRWPGLIAHAYVRYLGDLNGGQILKRLIDRKLGLDGAGLSFYDFPMARDPRALALAYRDAIDRAGLHLEEVEPVLAEAESAFRFNIALGEEIKQAGDRVWAP